jgi:hypothetical protein
MKLVTTLPERPPDAKTVTAETPRTSTNASLTRDLRMSLIQSRRGIRLAFDGSVGGFYDALREAGVTHDMPLSQLHWGNGQSGDGSVIVDADWDGITVHEGSIR